MPTCTMSLQVHSIGSMDEELHKQALSIVGRERDQGWDASGCTMLTAFAPYCSTALLNPGGSGVLEPQLRQNIAPALKRAQAVHSIACGQHCQLLLIHHIGPLHRSCTPPCRSEIVRAAEGMTT